MRTSSPCGGIRSFFQVASCPRLIIIVWIPARALAFDVSDESREAPAVIDPHHRPQHYPRSNRNGRSGAHPTDDESKRCATANAGTPVAARSLQGLFRVHA